jgi:hypothetical protein
MSKYIKVKDRVKYGMGALDRGPYAILHSSAVLAAHPEIVSYCNTIRYHLLKDLSPAGPEHLSTARHVILSSCCRKISKMLVIEESLTEDKLLAAGPLLDLWMQLNKAIRDDLRMLGLDRVTLEADASVLETIEKDYAPGGRLGPALLDAPKEGGES